VDTLTDLATRHPNAQRYFLIGEDLVDEMPMWRSPERIVELAEVIVLSRGVGAAAKSKGLRRLTTRRVDISSTEIRARVRSGLTVHGFVPHAVEAYIREAGLYR
jgi:nicotinate-nucleotide adenylyltransferase